MSNLIVWLIVGLIAGFLASKVLRGRGLGIPMDIVVGIVGAWIGGYLAGLAHISIGGGFFGEVIVAFAGAVILLLALRLLTGGILRHA